MIVANGYECMSVAEIVADLTKLMQENPAAGSRPLWVQLPHLYYPIQSLGAGSHAGPTARLVLGGR